VIDIIQSARLCPATPVIAFSYMSSVPLLSTVEKRQPL